MTYDRVPARPRVTSHHWRGALWTLVALGIIAGLVIGGWQLGWWIKGASVNRNARILQHNDGRQTAYIDQVRHLETDLRAIDSQIALSPDQAATLRAQQSAERDQLCAAAGGIDSPPADVVAIMAREGCA